MAQVRFKGLNIVIAIKREVFGIVIDVPEVPSDTFGLFSSKGIFCHYMSTGGEM